MNFVLEWSHALNGSNNIPEVLDQLLRIVYADAALIVRTSKPSGKADYIARCCLQEGKAFPTQPQTKAEFVLGDSAEAAKAGSIWKFSDMKDDNAPIFPFSRAKLNGIGEVIVIPLEAKAGHVDYLELHYLLQPREFEMDLLSIMASTLASGWSRRVPGTISARLEQGRGHRLRAVESDSYVPILDPQNPADLSRCEFRICAMMKEGMTVKKISQSLSVCPTTVRSHLSSIFAKTGVSNQVELLHQLNRKAETPRKFVPSEIARVG
ncbi:helix-turn-helix transcriptional regulator [Ruegeria sp. SCP11]|uniref:helix-turn-helix transcriptional regulator n=1 Tax=Ruegeria sp. SCP11 TaxID=3141378 RepID=UPI00333DF9D9